jgi:hypothetical protein
LTVIVLTSTVAMLLAWLLLNAVTVVRYRDLLLAIVGEPVLRHPVLVLESDDWGAGPAEQAAALNEIAAVLERHRDASGRRAVVCLALILAVPDGPAIGAGRGYRRLTLAAPGLSHVLTALFEGQARGVFALQLHGLEHYWPPTLMQYGAAEVQQWLRQPGLASTEKLPSPLQSRWVDAARLPSSPLDLATVQTAVADEVRLFEEILGAPPKVAVPPTFVWTTEIEKVWERHGVECVVTPGWRSTCRNASGLPDGDEGPIANGDRQGKVTYLVRNGYFEPIRGRNASHALSSLDRAVAEGRPCILENHRDNFIGDGAALERSLGELDRFLRSARDRHRNLRFLTSWELARLLRDRDPRWLVTSRRECLAFWMQRLRNTGRPWKLLSLTGLAALFNMLAALLGAPRSAPHP